MLTLYTTPVVYLYLDRIRLRWAALRGHPHRGDDGSVVARENT